jgi:hypothetical protein
MTAGAAKIITGVILLPLGAVFIAGAIIVLALRRGRTTLQR